MSTAWPISGAATQTAVAAKHCLCPMMINNQVSIQTPQEKNSRRKLKWTHVAIGLDEYEQLVALHRTTTEEVAASQTLHSLKQCLFIAPSIFLVASLVSHKLHVHHNFICHFCFCVTLFFLFVQAVPERTTKKLDCWVSFSGCQITLKKWVCFENEGVKALSCQKKKYSSKVDTWKNVLK